MRRLRTPSIVLPSIIALLVSVGSGCAEERPPINRVQANALSKTFFVNDLADETDNPIFYARAFVIDETAGQHGLSVGLYSGTDRIKWEITEDTLVAHKAYQIVQGQDDHGLPAGPPNGVVVAKYKILSHFDIKRAYNPTTGEEQNIIEENTSDRPWNEREYMRVDWSTNTVDDPMWSEVFLGKLFGDMKVTPQTSTVTDPNSDEAPHFEVDDGYFDITNKYYVEPSQTYFAPWKATLPTCALVGIFTGTTSSDCNAQEATVRHSFWKVKPDHDFEPTENTKRKMDIIANFGGAGDSRDPAFAGGTTQCWDPQYGNNDACFHQYLSKLNIWSKSHADIACDDNLDADGDGTADQCAAYKGSKGSQCDLFSKKCTLPYRDRGVQSVGYWLSKETPTDLLDQVDASGKPTGAVDDQGLPVHRGALEDVIKSWNQLTSAAVGFSREAECRRTGDGDRATCHGLYFEADADNGGQDKLQMIAFGGWGVPVAKRLPSDDHDVLVACHAPVRSYDLHKTCGNTGDVARNGDQRKNFIFYWPYDSDAHYGGVAGLGQDPESGESHGVSATIMGRSATRAAASYRDYIQYAMGDTTLDDVVDGVPQSVYQKVLENGFSPDSDRARIARGDAPSYAATPSSRSAAQSRSTPMRVQDLPNLQDQLDRTYDPLLQSSVQAKWEALASKLRGTTYEADLVDPSFAMAATGSDPESAMDASTLDQASPLRNLDSGRIRTWKAEMAAKLANHGVCFLDDVPRVGSINFQGMSRWYADKFADLGMDADIKAGGPRDPALVQKRGEYIYQDLWKGMATGIAIHEVGHTLGMRHNFASSYDAVNYMPQYWQVRSNYGQSTTQCSAARDPSSPDTCLGPRYLDPETDDERGLSPRDASGRSNGRPGVGYFGNSTVMEYEVDYMSPGIGPYDFSYVKAVYGNVLETYDLDRDGGIKEGDQGRFVGNIALQRSEINVIGQNVAHYTDQAREMHLFKPSYCRAATQEELDQGQWRVVGGQVCTTSPRDHAAWMDFRDETDKSVAVPSPLAAFGWPFTAWRAAPTTANQDKRLHVRWNYRYGETYDTSYMHTNLSDTGADVYELATNNTKLFDLTYPLSYFRRGNKTYMYGNIPSVVADKYFERARAYNWVLAGSNYGEAYDRARRELFYFLTRATTVPEPGNMSKVTRPDGLAMFDADGSGGGPMRMSIIDGRYASEQFSDQHGGQWDYLSWIDHAGYSVERGLAMRALVDGRPVLYTISRDSAIDGRNVMINFRSDQQRGVDRFIGGILAEDFGAVGMWVNPKDAVPATDGGLPYASPQQLNLLDDVPMSSPGATPLFPDVAYKAELAAVIFTHLFSRLNSDATLVDKMKIYIDGIDFINALPDDQQARFTDPVTGFTYVAHLFGDDTINGRTVDAGISSRMLRHANDLLIAAYAVEMNEDSKPTPVLDSYGRPHVTSSSPVNADANDALRKYIGLVDATRDVGRMLDSNQSAGE